MLPEHLGVVSRLYGMQHRLLAAEVYREYQRLNEIHKLVLGKGQRPIALHDILLAAAAAKRPHDAESFVGGLEELYISRVELLSAVPFHRLYHKAVGTLAHRADVNAVGEMQLEGELPVGGAAAAALSVGKMVI